MAAPKARPRGTPALAWRTSAVNAAENSPTVAGGIAYVDDARRDLVALDVATGEVRWRYRHGPGVCSNLTVVGNVAYAGCEDTHLYAVDATTGQLLWRYDAGTTVDGPPNVVGGMIYIGTERRGKGGAVVALDATTGQERWRVAVDGDLYGALAVTGDVAYVPVWLGSSGSQSRADSEILALSTSNGTLLWSREIPGLVERALTVVDNIIYLGSSQGVCALDAATGDLRWRFIPTGDTRLSWTPAVAGGIVYASGRAPYLYALDATTGEERWHAAIGSVGGPPVSPATVADGVIYVGGDGLVAALDAVSGAERWRFTGDFSVAEAVSIGDGFVLFGAAEPAGTDFSRNLAARGALYALANPDQGAPAAGGAATPT